MRLYSVKVSLLATQHAGHQGGNRLVGGHRPPDCRRGRRPPFSPAKPDKPCATGLAFASLCSAPDGASFSLTLSRWRGPLLPGLPTSRGAGSFWRKKFGAAGKGSVSLYRLKARVPARHAAARDTADRTDDCCLELSRELATGPRVDVGRKVQPNVINFLTPNCHYD